MPFDNFEGCKPVDITRIACKDCVYRDKKTEIGPRKAKCEKYMTKPHRIIFDYKECEYYEKEE